ncbi:MAG: IclR family transcriptional regulator [Deltaproteobacteria bacterium]|nr:IclR family transcriptional regulator [Deltaproteobacteria bacterium]
MNTTFKRVPALEKCFAMLELLSKNRRNFGISDIANALGYHKGTVFNMVHTLSELGILEKAPYSKFRLGPQLYALGKAAGGDSDLIQTVHPFLEQVHQKTNLSVFLGILIKDMVVTVDKVDSPEHLKVSSEIGMATPILAGAVGKIILSGMSQDELEQVLNRNTLRRFTSYSIVDRREFLKEIESARRDGFAFSDQEYIEGIRALAVPLHRFRNNLRTAMYVVGLNSQIRYEDIDSYVRLLKETAQTLNDRLAMT